jgi:trk system potassium uptake protein TrkA
MTGNLRVIIAGGGRVGFQTAIHLADRGDAVTIIEPDGETVDRIADEWIATIIQGDATNPDILEQAGIDRADVVAGLTGKSGVNLATCLAATELNPSVRTVARIEESDGDAYTELVDAVVFPESAGAQVAANEIAGSDIETVADITADVDVMHIRVAEGAPAAGKQLSEVRFPSGTLVISDGGGVATPELALTAGEQYLVAVEPDVVDEVVQLFHG